MTLTSDPETTDFGFERVALNDKVKRVEAVFSSVASRYDVMNDLMSLGIHRLWKRQAVAMCNLRPGYQVLDLAGGTGDLACLMLPQVAPTGHIYLADINTDMLQQGRARLLNSGIVTNVSVVQLNAEVLPFPDNYFDCITIAFGLRNVSNKLAALKSMCRVLKPGGHVIILEFSKPHVWLQALYDAYSFQVLPRLGQWVARDADSYCYLAESIRMHPDQETLKQLMLHAGFNDCDYTNLTQGIVAVHRGFKY